MSAPFPRRGSFVVLVVGVLLLGALGVTVAVDTPGLFSHGPPHLASQTGSSGPFSWTNISATAGGAPACRDSEGLVDDAALGEVILFGGVSQCGQPNSYSLGDTWAFSNGTWTNLSSSLTVAPSPRWGMAMVYDAAAQEIVLFGGTDTFGNTNDQTWTFNGTWTNVTAEQTVSPPALFSPGATYDPSVGGLLLYGGESGFSGPEFIYNATWLFHDGQWSELNVMGPDPLRSPSLVYDAAANASILFGGYDGLTNVPINQTWSFANDAWILLHPSTSPSARFTSGATYDPVTGAIVLFAGFTYQFWASNVAVQDTWSFANGTWTNVTVPHSSTPSPRGGARMVWDVADGYGLLFGGQSNGVRFNDTWTFPLATPLRGATLTASSSTIWLSESVSFSTSTSGGFYPLTFVYSGLPAGCAGGNLSTFTCIPTAIGNYTVSVNVTDTNHTSVVASTILSVVTPPVGSFSWTDISATAGGAPACRDSEGLVDDAALGEVILFGGVSQCGQPNSYSLGDTWAFSNGTWTNLSSSLTVAPSPRWGMAMVYDAAAQEIVLFGGTDTFGNTNDQTWTFNGTWTNVTAEQTVSPPALFSPGATYDPSVGGLLLYGGESGFSGPEFIYNATWLFHDGQWSELNVTGPDPLRSPTLVYDAATSSDILFGGFDGMTGTSSGATWSFASGAWTLLSPSASPGARFAAGATFDPATGAVVLFGGFTTEYGNVNSPLSDTWTFVNGTWVNVTPLAHSAPSPRGGPRLVWDATDGYGILFGGQSNGYRYTDTWEFS